MLHDLKIKVIRNGRHDPVEVVLGRIQFGISIEIHRDHKITLLIQGFIKMQSHRVDSVVEVVEREYQFMEIFAIGFA